jgi:hypothetical protein
MKILLIIAAVLIIAGSFYADHKWRQWLARHRPDRDQ